MRYRSSLAFAVTGLVSLYPVLAHAAFDHLQCFKLKDTNPVHEHTLTLTPNQTQFLAATGCTIKTKAKSFCIDVQTSAVVPPAEEAVPASATRDFFCYALKCPSTSTVALPVVVDEFGKRSIEVKKTERLCVPAEKHQPGWLRHEPLATPDALYWTDTDGIAPETPGCHIPWQDPVGEATCAVPMAAPEIGEGCLTPDELLETNPGLGVCHSHNGYQGHPDVYSCDAFCKGTHGPTSTGSCVAVADHCAGGVDSAECVCVPASSASRGRPGKELAPPAASRRPPPS